LHPVGSHTPEISSSGCLTGHDPTHRDLMDPGSLDLEYLIIYISTGYTSPPTYMPMHAWPHTTYVVLHRRTCGVYHIPHPTLSLSPLPGSRDLGPLWISWIPDPTSPDLVIPRILGSCISPSHVSHIHHIPECCTARMPYYAMGVYVHAATLHTWE
jgi:hypothetical protein